jgi:hypothetical protein
MSQELAPISGRQLGRLGLEKLPLAIAAKNGDREKRGQKNGDRLPFH